MSKKKIDVNDLDDIIAIAEQLQGEEEPERLSFEEVQAIAKELDISTEAVQKAFLVLEEGRVKQAQEEQKQQERKALRNKRITQACLVAMICILLSFLFSYNTLTHQSTEVELHISYVQTALDRQAVIQKRYGTLEPTLDSNAELDGAENRVRVAQRRYDKAVNDYNRSSLSILHRVWIVFLGFPQRYPLSGEKKSW